MSETSLVNLGVTSPRRGEQLERLLYRILPYWPLIFLAIVVGFIGAKIYLRYQIPVYNAKARIIVNDQTEQKTANLQEIFKLDTRNLSAETEKEIQILSSKDLLAKVAAEMQLNVTYLQKGRIVAREFYGDKLPFRLEMENPDSLKNTFSGTVQLLDENTIRFNNTKYPIDSPVSSYFGIIHWRINKNYKEKNGREEYLVTISPLSRAVNVLKSGLRIDPISKQSSILSVTYSDPIPLRAIDILNNIFRLYGTSAVEYKSKIYENSQKFLDNRLIIISEDLKGVEKNLQNFKSSQGVTDLSSEGQLYLSQVKEADRKIGEIEVQLDVLNQIDSYVIKRNKSNDIVPATLGISDPLLLTLLGQLFQAETELQKTREISGNKNPQIEVLEDVVNKLRPGVLASLNNLKINLLAGKHRLEEDNSQMTAMLNKIPLKERLLLDISRQQAIKNAIYTFLLQKREESAIAAASLLPNFRVIEKPENAGILSPKVLLVYLIGFFTAITLAVLYIYLKEFSSVKILFRSQIEEILPIPVISELVYYDHDLKDPVVVGEGKRTLIAEQFRELRTNINYITASAADKCKVILATSSIPSEGKSFVAINAGISLSLTGDRVVVLEFDLRKPKISKPLGIERDPGLSNYLIGNATEEQIIKPHRTISNFYLIPSGPLPPNPAELMSGPRLATLFEYLKQHFDFILIDSPPIAAVTDAKILSPFADATLFIIRHNYTNAALLNLLKDVYQKKSLNNINIVFNGIKNKKIMGYSYGGYGYGYGYNYGYGYTMDDSKSLSGIKKLKSFFSRIFRKK